MERRVVTVSGLPNLKEEINLNFTIPPNSGDSIQIEVEFPKDIIQQDITSNVSNPLIPVTPSKSPSGQPLPPDDFMKSHLYDMLTQERNRLPSERTLTDQQLDQIDQFLKQASSEQVDAFYSSIQSSPQLTPIFYKTQTIESQPIKPSQRTITPPQLITAPSQLTPSGELIGQVKFPIKNPISSISELVTSFASQPIQITEIKSLEEPGKTLSSYAQSPLTPTSIITTPIQPVQLQPSTKPISLSQLVSN